MAARFRADLAVAIRNPRRIRSGTVGSRFGSCRRYHTKEWIAGVFPQYTWGIGGWNGDDKPDASYMSLLYFYFYNLPNAWQIGTNPTITYNHKSESDNKWNLPVGLTASKMTKFGKLPVKLQLGVEYSVISEDDFGQQAQVKLNIIPVIPALFKKPIFGE